MAGEQEREHRVSAKPHGILDVGDLARMSLTVGKLAAQSPHRCLVEPHDDGGPIIAP
jgi:hypothetical protein